MAMPRYALLPDLQDEGACFETAASPPPQHEEVIELQYDSSS
jgi:hypothetical protein